MNYIWLQIWYIIFGYCPNPTGWFSMKTVILHLLSHFFYENHDLMSFDITLIDVVILCYFDIICSFIYFLVILERVLYPCLFP